MKIFNSIKKTKIILAIALISLAKTASGQIFISLGYNAMIPFQLKDLNSIISKYNDEFPDQGKKMGKFVFMHGLNYKAGGYLNNWCIDVGYIGARIKRTSEGPMNRELRLSNSAFQLSIGKTNNPKSENHRTFGGLLDLGNIKIRSKSALVDGTKNKDWLTLQQQFYATIGAFARYNFGDPGVSLEAYIKFNPIKGMQTSITKVNKELRGDASKADPTDLGIAAGGFGVKLLFSISSN